jgi:hypothetical protein
MAAAKITRCAILCALAAFLLALSIHADKFIAAKNRESEIRQLTDGCLANISAQGRTPSLPCSHNAEDQGRPCTTTQRTTGFGCAPWSNSDTDILVQSATPEELELCTCVSTHILHAIPAADFHEGRSPNPAKLERFKAAVADATKQCGGATSDDQTSVRLQIAR